jgi:hypothetical protein
MRREEQLDLLLEQYKSGNIDPSSLNAKDAARIAAAASLARLNEIEVPSTTSGRIEERIRTRIHMLHQEEVVHQRHPYPRMVGYHPLSRRVYLAIASISLLLMLSFAFLGVTHAAANSLPGDPLYQVKCLEQQIALAQTHDQEKQVSLQIAHLSTALADLSTVVKEKRSEADITAALAVVVSDTQQSQHAVNSFPVGQLHEDLVKVLTGTLNDERATLLQLLSQLGWSQQLAFTNQLGHLGGQIPHVTQVTLARNINYTFILTITGKNFAPGVRLIIAQKPRGIVLQQTSTTLRVIINADDLPADSASSVGVLNPDGTAAQMNLPRDPDRLQHPANPLRNKPGTPDFIDRSNSTHYQAHIRLSPSVPWKWK